MWLYTVLIVKHILKQDIFLTHPPLRLSSMDNLATGLVLGSLEREIYLSSQQYSLD